MNKLGAFLLCAWLQVLQVAGAQEIVALPYQDQGRERRVEAVLTRPGVASNGKAVVILHHSGGWGAGTTRQYAEYLAAAGFTTLEPRMFNVRNDRFTPYLPQVFASLGYLGSLPGMDKEQISVMGLSFGGMLAVFTAAESVNAEFNTSGLRFARHAPFYPSCWLYAAVINRSLPRILARGFQFDPAALDRFVGRPMKIFSGAQDDYDSRDAQACHAMKASMKDEQQKSLTQVVVYSDATHGWDQPSIDFNEPVFGCKGTGCRIAIRANPAVTRQAMEELLEFLRQ